MDKDAVAPGQEFEHVFDDRYITLNPSNSPLVKSQTLTPLSLSNIKSSMSGIIFALA